MEQEKPQQGVIKRTIGHAISLWKYVSTGLWSDPRRTWWLNILRTINLSVQSFLSRDIQSQACAMTYRTMLAVVPALALLLAIGRGFGFQNVLQNELMAIFPAQQTAIAYMLNFVYSYLSEASKGVFVGVGIVFLVYTLISLLGNVESTFNFIWGQKDGRSLWRKVSDYTSMLLILPILMICTSSINLLLSNTLKSIFEFSFMTPIITATLEVSSCIMTWLFFTAVYMLIPNTKVKFINAFISGAIAGSAFMVLQWLFVTGTLYVTRYNAIYGSFAFLPLMMLWLQLVWMIILAGCVVCYSSQNVFAYNLANEVNTISPSFRLKVTIAITTLFVQRFVRELPPVTARYLMDNYDLPARLVTDITDQLCAAGVLNRVVIPGGKDEVGFQLGADPAILTIGELIGRIYSLGAKEFIPDFKANFEDVDTAYAKIFQQVDNIAGSILLKDLRINMDKPETELTHKL